MKSGLDQSLHQYPKGEIFCQDWFTSMVDILTVSSIPENHIDKRDESRKTNNALDGSLNRNIPG